MKKNNLRLLCHHMFSSVSLLNLNASDFKINEPDNSSSLTDSNLCPGRSERFNWPIIESCVPGYDWLHIVPTSSGLFKFSQNENNCAEDFKYLSKKSTKGSYF